MTVFTKHSILHVWQSSDYASGWCTGPSPYISVRKQKYTDQRESYFLLGSMFLQLFCWVDRALFRSNCWHAFYRTIVLKVLEITEETCRSGFFQTAALLNTDSSTDICLWFSEWQFLQYVWMPASDNLMLRTNAI